MSSFVRLSLASVVVVGTSCQSGSPIGNDAAPPTSLAIQGDLKITNGNIRLFKDTTPDGAPSIDWHAFRGSWLTGIDTAVAGGPRDFVLAAKKDWPAPGITNDVVYLSHNGDTAPTVGIGVTPAATSHRVQISAQDSEPAMGTLELRRTPNQTGDVLTVHDSSGAPRFWLDANYWIKGASLATSASVSIKADDVNGRPLVLGKADGSSPYGFQYAPAPSDTLYVRYFTGGVNLLALNPDGRPGFPNGLTTTSLRIESPVAPTTSSAPCTRGDLTFDDSYVYICVATNTWKRSALGSW